MAQVLTAAPASSTADRSLARNRTYLSVLIGHTISIVGDGFHSVALGFWVLQATGSGTAMATLMAVKTIVSVLLSPIAGTVADRVDRRKMMIAMDLVRFLLVAAMIPLIGMAQVPFALLVLVSALIAAAGTFAGPAFSASMVNIVGQERVGQASGLNQMVWTAAQIVGPLLGGLVYASAGGGTSFAVDSGSYLLSVLAILVGGWFASPRQESGVKSSFWADLKEGMAIIRKHGMIRSTMILAPAVNLFGNALGVLFPVMAVKVWLVTSQQFGLLEGAFPLGFLVGAGIIMALQSKLRRRGLWIGGGLVVSGLLVALVGNLSFLSALPITVLTGIALAFVNVLVSIILQKETPPEVQGRVFGMLGAISGAASPLGMMAAGALADASSPALLMTWCGVGIFLVATLGLISLPALRRYN